MTIYNRPITNSPNNDVLASQLAYEIIHSSIKIALKDDGVSVDSATIYVEFHLDLDTADETELDALIAAHIPKEEIEVEHVKVMEESIDPAKRTGGHFKATTIKLDIPSGIGISTHTWNFPYDISMLSIEYVGYEANKDDYFSVCVGPDTIIGAITGNIVATDVEINVSQTVIDNAFIGMKCNVTDLTNVDDLGYIIAIDSINNKITVTDAATQSFDATSPTYVRVAVEPVKDLLIDLTTSTTQVGASKIGGSFVSANTDFMVHYDNKDGVAKTFHAIMELLY